MAHLQPILQRMSEAEGEELPSSEEVRTQRDDAPLSDLPTCHLFGAHRCSQ